jgi:glucose/arabinose dehydrogenase
MKKWLVVILAVVLIAGGAWVFTKRKVGDVRPALLPSKVKVANLVDNLKVPAGYKIGIFAQELYKARDLQLSPGGTLLVAVQDRGQVVALPDKNADGSADANKVIVDGLRNAHGLAFYKNRLFVASETAINRYDWDESSLSISHAKTILQLPTGGRHVTRSLVFDASGNLYVSLGSTCDVCIEKHPWIAAVIKTNADGASPQIFAKGLRNAVFLTYYDSKVWGTEMGRDFLGDDLPPEEVNELKQGRDYGWPYCYGNRVPDGKFSADVGTRCAATEAPRFTMPAHTAPLGLRFIESDQFAGWRGELLVGQHGSWNSSVPVGYKVVRITEAGKVEDFITGFIQGSDAAGRPVDLEFDREGSLYLSDDKAGVVYKIAKS